MNMVPSAPLVFSNFDTFRSSFGPNSDSDFTLVNVNIRSLRKYWEEFKRLAEDANTYVDVFVLTEINVPDAILRLFVLKGFTAKFLTRELRRGGGIAVFCE